MKKIKKEIQDKSISQLVTQEVTIRQELAKLVVEFKSNPPKDTNTIVKKRRQLAMILAVMGEKKEIEKLKSEISPKGRLTSGQKK